MCLPTDFVIVVSFSVDSAAIRIRLISKSDSGPVSSLSLSLSLSLLFLDDTLRTHTHTHTHTKLFHWGIPSLLGQVGPGGGALLAKRKRGVVGVGGWVGFVEVNGSDTCCSIMELGVVLYLLSHLGGRVGFCGVWQRRRFVFLVLFFSLYCPFFFLLFAHRDGVRRTSRPPIGTVRDRKRNGAKRKKKEGGGPWTPCSSVGPWLLFGLAGAFFFFSGIGPCSRGRG